MRLPRRAPREAYRLYTEDEYLAGASWDVDDDVAPEEARPHPRRRRVVSVAVLLGATGAVGGVIALDSSQPRRSARPQNARVRASVALAQVNASVKARRLVPSSRVTSHPRPRPHSHRSMRHETRRGGPEPAEASMAAESVRRGASAYVGAAQRTRSVEFGFER